MDLVDLDEMVINDTREKTEYTSIYSLLQNANYTVIDAIPTDWIIKWFENEGMDKAVERMLYDWDNRNE